MMKYARLARFPLASTRCSKPRKILSKSSRRHSNSQHYRRRSILLLRLKMWTQMRKNPLEDSSPSAEQRPESIKKRSLMIKVRAKSGDALSPNSQISPSLLISWTQERSSARGKRRQQLTHKSRRTRIQWLWRMKWHPSMVLLSSSKLLRWMELPEKRSRPSMCMDSSSPAFRFQSAANPSQRWPRTSSLYEWQDRITSRLPNLRTCSRCESSRFRSRNRWRTVWRARAVWQWRSRDRTTS